MSEVLFRDAARNFAQTVFDDIRAFSKDPVRGISRQGYGPLENKVHEYLKDKARELDLEIETDRCGNLFLTLPSTDRSLPCYMTGSHADSVPQGGHYDGLAGVVAAITTMWGIRHFGIQPTAVQDNLWYEDLKRIKNIIDF